MRTQLLLRRLFYVLRETRLCQKAQNSIFPSNLDFPAILHKFLAIEFNLKEKFAWDGPFTSFLVSTFGGKGGKMWFLYSTNQQDSLKKRKKLLFRNVETHFQNAETRLLNAETP